MNLSASDNLWDDGRVKVRNQRLRHEIHGHPEYNDDRGELWDEGQSHLLHRGQRLQQPNADPGNQRRT